MDKKTKKLFNSVKTDFTYMNNNYIYVNLYNNNGKFTGKSIMLKDINGNEYFFVKGHNGNFSERLNNTKKYYFKYKSFYRN